LHRERKRKSPQLTLPLFADATLRRALGVYRVSEIPPCECCDRGAVIIVQTENGKALHVSPRCVRHVSPTARLPLAQAGELAAARKRRAAR